MRVGTFQSLASRVGTVLAQQRQLSDLNMQATSGRRDTRLSDLGLDAGRLIDVASEQAGLTAAVESLKGIRRSLDATDGALSSLQDLAQSGRAMLVQAMGLDNPKTDLHQVNARARAMLDDTLNVLNRRSEGRYLFNDIDPQSPPAAFRDEWSVRFDPEVPVSKLRLGFADGLSVEVPVAGGTDAAATAGTAESLRSALSAAGRLGSLVEVRADTGALYLLGNIGDATPGGVVAITADPPNGILAAVRNTRERADIDVRTVDYVIADGSTEALARRVADGVAIVPTVRVDEPAIEKMIRALRQLENADIQGADGPRLLRQANALLIESLDDFGALRTNIGLRAEEVDRLQNGFDGAMINAESTKSEIRDVDIADLMTKIAAQKVQLEAAYMMLSRFGELSLVNHLR